MICPYCGESKPASEMTKEHVLPQALGGNLRGTNPFAIQVCKRCNNLCGSHVDGPFVRNWLIHSARARVARSYYDPHLGPDFQLSYIGQSKSWIEEGTVCDLWFGRTGDQIYHFHKPYPGSAVFAGKPPHLRPTDLDPGFVYVDVVGTNPFWYEGLFKRVVNDFPDTEHHLVRVKVFGVGPPYPPVPPDREHHMDFILARQPSEAMSQHLEIDPHFDQRITAKLALGFGHLLLDPSFRTSDYATRLRNFLWERDVDKRTEMKIPGVPILGDQDDRFMKMMKWNHCHVIATLPADDTLGLCVFFYSSFMSTVLLSDTPSDWSGRITEKGTVWVVDPALRLHAGPMTVQDFVRHKEHGTGPLAKLKAKMDAATRYPPFHLPKDEPEDDTPTAE